MPCRLERAGAAKDAPAARTGSLYAEIHAQGGNSDRAFAELDNAVRAKDPGLQSLKSDPFLDPILRDPRYAALLKRLNFPTWA
ncbi:MAG TPA: hypothetical protein VFO12_08910 [Sphingomicrobium sp.]|nr:hypothetical protein [Sphingomicrobium sp.]